MHISEGVLAPGLLLGGGALTLGGLVRGLKDIQEDNLPRAAILAAVFFTASLIHINIGPASTHLVLSGLIGLVMGWAAFPVIFIGLLLQGLLFQFGGLTTLGVNTFNMAAPAVLLALAGRRLTGGPSRPLALAAGLVCGGGAILISSLLVGGSLYLSGAEVSFALPAKAIILANLPVMVIEALVTMFCVQFLRQVRPSLLAGPVRP
ncbi:MAG: cobalt transporter CbiM [Candidatus Adiutrix sp.]|jgi:cobalt/nickel transport system permease protein|nr:cobalt transporter CbiM [Candidatus Adiutrix sp.]